MPTHRPTEPRAVAEHLRRTLARLTGRDPAEIATDRPLRDLGVDSATVTELVGELCRFSGQAVPTSAGWRYPTITALAAFACGQTPAAADGAWGAVGDPVAIVGIGCRLPGGIEGPDALWRALRGGVDAVGEVPADRWDASAWHDADPAAPGRIVTRAGGFLDDVAGFDADLFGIAPVEARHTDPQQRITLEVAWSALEDARFDPRSLAGTRTGVFLGAMAQEYHLATGASAAAIGAHSAVGWDNSIIAARVAYALDLRGPALAVATACSSSLTALHLAVQSLRRRESDLALAGGVNLILHPHTSVAMSKFGGLSPDGRCRAFSADAAGYVRAEGAGVVVVRRLADALRAGDRIYAVVRGTAVTSDGASNGITAPNPEAQVAVVRAALRDGGVEPAEVSYVEAHGTGTPLGDPIEADALGEVFAAGRTEPLLLGSVKSNVGHLEPAAGVTGVIKTALALHHGDIPASLHYAEPNPRIDFAANRLDVVTGSRAWPGRGRVAGVSSFGFGGTNAHAVLAAPPAPPRLLVALAADTEDGLRELADGLATESAALFDRGPVVTAGEGPLRLFAAVEHPDALADALAAAPVHRADPAARLALFFSGHGSQWPGMAVGLLAEPAFRAALLECDAAIAGHTGWSVLDELLGDGERLDRADVVQPVLFAVQVATAALLRGWGLAPDVVLGQSIGEVAAAVVAGALSVAQGARVISAWSALVTERAGGQGGITVADVAPDAARAWVAAHAPALAVAAHLGTRSALAGPLDALTDAETRLAAEGVKARRVRIDYAAHSPMLAEYSGELSAALADVRGQAATVPMLSTVTGRELAGTDLDGGYWARNMAAPMLVAEAAAELAGAGPVSLVEVAPHPVAARSLAETVPGVLATGDRDRPARWVIEELAGALWAAGLPVRWDAVAGHGPAPATPVPVVVSGRTPAALAANAARLAERLSGADLLDVAYTAADRRAALDHRVAVTAADAAEAAAALRAVADGTLPAGVAQGRPLPGAPAVLFTGQGSQRPGMGAELCVAFPVFGKAFDEVGVALEPHLSRPLAEVLGTDAVHATEFAQAALFAFEVALFRLWESWGLRGEVLVGHSVGELAAAHCAGMLSLADAAKLVAARGRLMQACPSGGAMVSVEAGEDTVRAALVDGVVLAAVNGPAQCVISGDADAVVSVAEGFAAQGKRTKRLTVSHAFHSHHMDSMLEAFREIVASCTFSEPTVPVISSVTGEPIGTDPGYWVDQVRRPVHFLGAIRAVHATGTRVHLEIGPAAVLSAMAAGCLPAEDVALVPSLRAGQDEVRAVTGALGALHCAGTALDWRAVFPGARPTDLPGYAFQRTRYWLDGATPAPPAAGHAYETVWRPAPARAGQGRRLVVALPGGDTTDVVAALTAAGVDVGTDPAAPGEVAGVLAVAGPGTDPVDLPAVRATIRLLTTVDAPLRVVTRGAVRCGDTDLAPDPAQAALLGLGQVVAQEYPGRWAGLLDLADGDTPDAAALTTPDDADAAVRDGVRLVRRLRRHTGTAPRWRPRGTVLVTGGSGALAAHTARWLAERGAEHIVLASRRGADAPGAGDLRAELETAGARVTLARCDVTDPASVATLVADLAADPAPLRAVLHTAGAVADRLLADLDPDAPLQAPPAKVGGALALHAATRDLDLDAFVLFSSVIGVVGNAGQGDYAAANAAVDAVAALRGAEGLPVSCVAWGPWAEGGMAAGRVGEHLRGLGMLPMPVAEALSGLDAAIAAPGPVVFAALDWPAAVAALGPRPLFAEIPEARAADTDTATGTATDTGLRAELAALPAADRDRRLRDLVATEAAAVLGLPDADGLDHRRGFRDLGFDSMMGVDFARRIGARTGLPAPRTLSFDRPDVAAVATWLAEALDLTRTAQTVTAAATGARDGDDPVAVVGVGLRMPGGAHDLDSLWTVLAQGHDTLREVGHDRFDPALLADPVVEAQDRPVVRHAALLDDVAGFDAAFFGISPREAEPMDPQHRLLLEVAWEALEHAGLRPDLLRDSVTGVFVGAGPGEYGTHRISGDRDTYTLTGTLPSFAAGRVAYHLGLQGPAFAVDTACSSSLVAVHLAAEAVRAGECDTALAAGVQILADPAAFTALNRSRALAPDGRSKTFAADADGYGRGEGVGVLVLMRLSQARRDGHPVLGVLRGTAVNHDGASAGITAPNGTAQQRVLRAALTDGGLAPSDVDYVECHGTGTSLGDPIEVAALAEVYGTGRDVDRPLGLGTAKSVIGHLESAAGVAGVCKVLASLRHSALPATVRSTPRNPALDWDTLPVRVVDEPTVWTAGGRVRRAGVSSFGLSGTNAHVIVEEAPAAAPTESAEPLAETLPFVLSGRDEAALRAQAARWATWLRAHPDADWPAVVRAAAARTPFPHRAAVLATGPDTAAEALDTLAAGGTHADVLTGTATEQGGVAFVFPGQGAQWQGMARELLAAAPVFVETIARCDTAFGWSLTDMLRGEADLDRVDVVQPLLFAVGLGLVELWRSLGVEPGAVVGHSQGEVGAAVVAGALSLADAARVVTARSRAVRTVSGGGMALVEAPLAWVEERLIDGVGVAAVNTPRSTVVSGTAGELDAFVALAEAEGVFCRRVAVDYASHSAQMDQLLPGLRAELAGIAGTPTTVPFHSSVHGRVADGAELDGEYWGANLRRTVRFDRALESLLADRVSVFVEMAPHPVLGLSIADAVAERGGVVVGSLARRRGGLAEILRNLARLHVAGHEVDWSRVLGAGAAAELPPYAFQHERYWSAPAGGGDARALGLTESGHPWLPAATALADGGHLLTGRLDPDTHPWLRDHTVFGSVLVPGTGLLDLVLAAGRVAGTPAVADLTLTEALHLRGPVRLQVTVGPEDADGIRTVALHSRPDTGTGTEAGGRWTRHATGRLAPAAPGEHAGTAVPSAATPVDLEAVRAGFTARGIDYGPAFGGLTELWRHGTTAYGVTRLPDGLATAGYGVHPALLDAALHTLQAVPDPADPADGALLPVRWTGVELAATDATEVHVRVDVTEEPEGRRVRVWLTDPAGAPVARADGLDLHRATAAQLRADHAEDLYTLAYQPVSTSDTTADGTASVTAVVGDAAVAEALGAQAFEDTAALLASGLAPDRVVAMVPDGPAAGAAEWTLASLTDLLGEERLAGATLAWVTRDAAPTGDGPRDATHGPVAGLLRVARTEHPDRDVRLVDLLGGDPAGLAAALSAGEPETAVRAGTVLAPRLVPAHDGAGEPVVPDPDGVVLLTGGTGELGAAVAGHLVERYGARRLLLASRRGPAAPGAAELVAGLRDAGADAEAVAVDVTDRAALAALLAEHPVTTVVHLAGVLDDGLLAGRDPESLRIALAPKVTATRLLAELAPAATLVLFSSAAGTFGTAGQGVYAAANTGMDALAESLVAAGRTVVNLAWGLWEQSGVGMTAHLGATELARMRAQGIAPLPVADGLALLDAALRRGPGRYVPVRLDTRALCDAVPPLLRALVRPAVAVRTAAAASAPAVRSLRDELLARPAARRAATAAGLVCAEVADVLGLAPDAVDPAHVLKQLGLDSLMAVELRRRLAARSGLTLPATLAFDYPTPAAIAGLLLDRLDLDAAAEPAEESTVDDPAERLRWALDRVPAERLRETGLLDRLVELAAEAEPSAPAPEPAAAPAPKPARKPAPKRPGRQSVADINAELDAFLQAAEADTARK